MNDNEKVKCPWCGEDNEGPTVLCPKCELLATTMKARRGL